jgi:hypothetical protein
MASSKLGGAPVRSAAEELHSRLYLGSRGAAKVSRWKRVALQSYVQEESGSDALCAACTLAKARRQWRRRLTHSAA